MKFFAANWKLYKSPAETRVFFENFHKRNKNKEDEIIFFPSAFSLEACQQMCRGSRIRYGAQNIYSKGSGAYTGENSAQVLKSMGGRFALVGHSERRQLFAENNELISAKVSHLVSENLSPVLCIGESLEQRKSNQTLVICKEQLEMGLKAINPDVVSTPGSLIVAYEPIWAIGTGVVASAAQVQETHAEIALILQKLGYASTPLLYGGSVKPENAKELIKIDHVDGFLVGGASLDHESFAQICEANLL